MIAGYLIFDITVPALQPREPYFTGHLAVYAVNPCDHHDDDRLYKVVGIAIDYNPSLTELPC